MIKGSQKDKKTIRQTLERDISRLKNELLTFIDFADKFTLGFIEINFPPDAELLIKALKQATD